MRMALVLVATAATAVCSPCAAWGQDSDAPRGALPHWLPSEDWVYQHWLPYDETRLYRVLGADRAAIWEHLRDDQVHNLGQLARRRGMTIDVAARRLVEPRLDDVSPVQGRELVDRARRTLTQGHMSQHILFHSLHQLAIPDRAVKIFGTPTKEHYLALRRAEVSPLQIGRLYGREGTDIQAAAAAALKAEARRGARIKAFTRRQADILLDRQLRQLPRFLGQRRYNGPPQTGPGSRPLLPPFDFASNPSISADGSAVVFDAYRATIPEAKKLGEIHVVRADPSSGALTELTPPARLPESAYNAELSADGGTVVLERAPGNLNFAKRYGRMEVQALYGGRSRSLSHPRGLRRARTAYNPSVSADGSRTAFEVSDDGGPGRRSSNALLVFDGPNGQLLRVGGGSGYGAVYEPRISGDGRWVVFSAGDAGADGHTLVYVRRVADRHTDLVSRATGRKGVAADGDSREPAVSHDGRTVAFASTAGNLGGGRRGESRIYVRDLESGSTTLVRARTAGVAFDPALSPDARFVAYGVRRSPNRSVIELADRRTADVRVVSAGDGPGAASEPVVSADGRLVAYTTTAPVGDKPDRVPGVVVRDLAAGTVRVLSTHAPIKAGPGARPSRARARAASAGHRALFCDLAG